MKLWASERAFERRVADEVLYRGVGLTSKERVKTWDACLMQYLLSILEERNNIDICVIIARIVNKNSSKKRRL